MEREHLNVLLIEDDEDDFFIVQRLLKKARTISCSLTWKSSYEEGLEAVCSEAFDVAVVDYRLGARTGLELLAAAGERSSRTPLILMTGQGGTEIDLKAMQAGAADYLTKTKLDSELLERAIRYARERARSEREIRRQAALLDEARDAICAYDLDGNVTFWNEGAVRMTGYDKEDVCNLHSADCLYGAADQQAIDEAWTAVRRDGQWSGELRQETRDGRTITVKSRWTLVRSGNGEPQAVLVINSDITERKRLEAQALRSQRMESIGRLVGGIAHDLGNLLVPIQLGVSVLRDRHGGDDRTKRTLRMIEKSAERGADMVERVLSFARGVEGDHVPLDLCEIAEEVERLVEESFPSHIDFEARLSDDLPPVRGDATQLQQVLVNLSVNARDAMPDGGRLTLEAQAVHLPEGDTRLLPDVPPGHYLHVCVEDTGTGIPPDVLDKIFEPFFSTKSSDDGTGLGLSTVYSIVKSHGGFVDVQSETGKGTCFDVFLPAADEMPEDEAAPVRARQEDAPPSERHGRNETVLVIDDETFIRESAEGVLADAGYRPLTAPGLQEAMRLFETHPVEAVITDVSLSGTSGLEIVHALKSRRPEVPVIVCSGQADGQFREAQEAGADHFLSKPFGRDELCEALDAVLSSQREMA